MEGGRPTDRVGCERISALHHLDQAVGVLLCTFPTLGFLRHRLGQRLLFVMKGVCRGRGFHFLSGPCGGPTPSNQGPAAGVDFVPRPNASRTCLLALDVNCS
jgi:hypothetical protein